MDLHGRANDRRNCLNAFRSRDGRAANPARRAKRFPPSEWSFLQQAFSLSRRSQLAGKNVVCGRLCTALPLN
jgi:hypothetical protein